MHPCRCSHGLSMSSLSPSSLQMGLPQRPSSAPGRRSSVASSKGGRMGIASGSSSKIRARSPVIAWAKRAGLDRLTTLQQAYINVCETQVMPPVNPDITILDSLIRKRVEVNIDSCSRDALYALTRFFESDEAKDRLVAITITAGDVPQRMPRGRGGSSSRRGGDAATLAATEKATSVVRKLMSALGKLLARTEVLHDLAFHGVSFVPADLKLLAAGLSKNEKLSAVSFSGSCLGDVGFKEVSPALAVSRVNLIDLSSTSITSASALQIARLVKAHGGRRDEAVWSASLRGRTVDRSDRQFGNDISSQGLCLLDLSGNSFDAQGLTFICGALEGDSWLLGMNVADSGAAFTPQQARAIIQNPSLVALVLRHGSHKRPPSPPTHNDDDMDWEVEVLSTLADRPWPTLPLLPKVSSTLRAWRQANQRFLDAATTTGPPPIERLDGYDGIDALPPPTNPKKAGELLEVEAVSGTDDKTTMPVPQQAVARSAATRPATAPASTSRKQSTDHLSSLSSKRKEGGKKVGPETKKEAPAKAAAASSSSATTTSKQPRTTLKKAVVAPSLSARKAPAAPAVKSMVQEQRASTATATVAKKPALNPATTTTAPPPPARAKTTPPPPSSSITSTPSAKRHLVTTTTKPPSPSTAATRKAPSPAHARVRGADGGGSHHHHHTTSRATAVLIQQLVTRMGVMTDQVAGLESTLAQWRVEQTKRKPEEEEEKQPPPLYHHNDDDDGAREVLIKEISKNVQRRLKEIWDL